jgi:photosystem II stability/assembly factor-like uncharacterized protein
MTMATTLLCATRKGLFTFRRAGKGTWRTGAPEFLAAPVSMVLQDPRDRAVYAALDHGHFGVKLHRRDGGRWTEIAVPALPKPRRGQVEKDGFGRPWPRTLKLIWSLEIDPRRKGALWCGTIPGGLFHSRDRGASWTFVDGLWEQKGRRKWTGGGYDTPGIHSICVDPRDASVVTVGVSCGGVWRTQDGGETWANIAQGMRAEFLPKARAFDPDVQDPHRIVQCDAAPDRLWAQHHNGIFVTDGARWREVTAKAPSRFGFACAVHPQDPDCAWFVPAQKDECRVPVGGRLVVTRTRDGGKTLEVLARGLPKAAAWDLVYRHGLDVGPDGRMLAMGSTTGGLWASEDGGRGWTELSAHLPPVYAVRLSAS